MKPRSDAELSASNQTLYCSVMSLNMTLYVKCGAIEMRTGSSKIALCLLFSVIHLMIDLSFHF